MCSASIARPAEGNEARNHCWRTHPRDIDVAAGIYGHVRTARPARVVREVHWSRERGASVAGAGEEDLVIAGCVVLPDAVDVAAGIHSNLPTRRAGRVVREVLRGRESSTPIGRATVQDSVIARGVVEPDDVDAAFGVHGDLRQAGSARVTGHVLGRRESYLRLDN